YTGRARFSYGTVGYSAAGAPLWTNHYGASDFEFDFANAIAVDSSGNVFVTGRSDDGGGFDYATIKYSAIPPSRVQLAIEPDGSGGYFIRFEGVPGSAYRLQRGTILGGPWLTSAPQTAPASGLLEFWDLFPPPAQAFYRAITP